jgi:hypothetical protein
MPSRSFPVGATSIPSLLAVLGNPTGVSLVTVASGTAQNGYKMPTDVSVVTGASASHTAVTLPDPFLQGWGAGDWFECINGTTQACVIFPPTGGNINNAGANASVALAANKSVRVYVVSVASAASVFTTMTGA